MSFDPACYQPHDMAEITHHANFTYGRRGGRCIEAKAMNGGETVRDLHQNMLPFPVIERRQDGSVYVEVNGRSCVVRKVGATFFTSFNGQQLRVGADHDEVAITAPKLFAMLNGE